LPIKSLLARPITTCTAQFPTWLAPAEPCTRRQS
jgi:hypothetical protein